jgi:hypothetical protein
MSELQASGLFPNGAADILTMPLRANPDDLDFFPKDVGLAFDFGGKIADRVIEEDINLRMKAENENDQTPFNIVTYQTIRVKKTDAFMKLDNLVTV